MARQSFGREWRLWTGRDSETKYNFKAELTGITNELVWEMKEREGKDFQVFTLLSTERKSR